MTMWVIFAFAAVLLWATVSVIDKHIVSDELRDPALVTVVWGLTLFILLSLITFSIGTLTISTNIAIAAIIAGIINVLGAFLYYHTMKKEEATRAVSIFHVSPLFVLILASIFLGESFGTLEYIGMVALILGAIIISIKKETRFTISHILFFAILTALVIAVHNIILKYSISNISLINIFFWFGLGGLISSAIIYAFHHPRIKQKMKSGIEHIILVGVLDAIALLLFLLAMSLENISVISAFTSIQPLVLFILVFILAEFHSKIIREKLDRTNAIIKLLGIILIVYGLVQIV